MDFDTEEDELEDDPLLPKKDDDPLFLGVDDDDLLGGVGDEEKSEDDELDAFGLHVEEEEEPEF